MSPMQSLPALLDARLRAVTGVDPEMRPATKPQFGHFQSSLDRTVDVTLCHAREGKVSVQAIQWLSHVTKRSGIALDDLVRQAIEGRGEAEPLQLIGRRAVTIDILLHVFSTSREKLERHVCLALHKVAFGQHDRLSQLALLEPVCILHDTSSYHTLCEDERCPPRRTKRHSKEYDNPTRSPCVRAPPRGVQDVAAVGVDDAAVRAEGVGHYAGV